MKGVILAGGTGSRLSPLTRITNKHLLPIYDQPMIFYPIQTLVRAGVRDVLLVTGGNNAGDFLRLLGDGREFGLNRLAYTYQQHAGGIAEALGLAEAFVDGDRCIVILGDNIIEDDLSAVVQEFEHQERGAKILLKEVDNPQDYGVPIFSGDEIVHIQEKPLHPRSRYAVTGIYLYDSQVFDIVRRLKPSARGELEITDVNNRYIDLQQMTYAILRGWWGDAGASIEAYAEAFNWVAARRREARGAPLMTSPT